MRHLTADFPCQDRKISGGKRAALTAGIAIGGLAVTAATLYTEAVTSIIARRRSPLNEALASFGEGDPTPEQKLHEEQAESLRAIPTETVAIRSDDGLVLRAHFYPCDHPQRILLLAHGWHSEWCGDFAEMAPFFHENGCSLLMIDQRCHGESGGDLISYGIRERHDIVRWLHWIANCHPGYPVYLGGVSMGAATVLMAAGLPIAGQVSGIIADCAYSSPKEIVHMSVKKHIGKWTAPTMAAVGINLRLKGKFSLSDDSPLEAMTRNHDIPVLFIHGDADDFVPWRMSFENYVACQAPKDLLIVPGAGHARCFRVNPTLYQEKVLAFFARYDPPLPPPPQPDESDTALQKARKKARKKEAREERKNARREKRWDRKAADLPENSEM